jgi:hypothetical protein
LLRRLALDALLDEDEHGAAFARLAELLVRWRQPGCLRLAIACAEQQDDDVGSAHACQAYLLRRARRRAEVLGADDLKTKGARRAGNSLTLFLHPIDERADEELHGLDLAEVYSP